VKKEIEKIIEEYQCAGCVGGKDPSCYEKGEGVECKKHAAGTVIQSIGRVFLGMPRGFNRLGLCDKTKILIFEEFEDGWGYHKFNVPVWKHLDNNGNTLVRGICPRTNDAWIHIFIGDHISKISCLEITQEDLSEMD